MKYYFLIIIIGCFCPFGFAQETVVKGRVMEKGKPESLPFVSIYFKGTQKGVSSDFEGNFLLKANVQADSVVFSYMGYKTITRKIQRGQTQVLQIEMEPDSKMMNEVVIIAGENPALRIVKKAAENRGRNSQQSLKAYSFSSYTKVDVSMDNISEKMKNNRMFKPIKSLFDTANQIINEEGKYILPIFVSETYSKFYQQNDPWQQKEIIEASNINGFWVDQGSYVLDMMGSGLLEFNFNQNWIRFLAKDFMSPIADGGNAFYIYTLRDSTFIDGVKCYEIRLNLRREEDLGFLGTMWIADSSFAIKRIDVEIAPSANINFLDRLKIQQEMTQVPSGAWLPSKTRGIIDLAELGQQASGFVAKMYRANQQFTINQQQPSSFFDAPVVRDEHMLDHDSDYWNTIRTEPFSVTEKQMINMIDSVKKVPVVKSYLEVIQLIVEGYYRKNKIDYGPYLFLFGYNEVEQFRMRLGFKTNNNFSKKWFLRSYVAYGFGDERFKYGLGIDRVLSYKHWTTLGFQHKNDFEILGITDPTTTPLHGGAGSNLFAALSFANPGSRINRSIDYRMVLLTQPKRDWTFRTTLQHTYYQPLGSFVFAYKNNPGLGIAPDNLESDITYSCVTFEARYAYKEIMVQRGMDRVQMQRPVLPALTFLYTQGLQGILNSQFNYQKFEFNISQHINTGILGNADYSITAGKIYGTLPYPLLEVSKGNATIIYSDMNFSLMNLYEFVADEYVSARYIQHFEGLFFNRIPGIRSWKLRNFGLVKAASGSLSNQNFALMPATDGEGTPVSPVYRFKDVPYVEVGYGIENILRFGTLGVIHRLTYRDNVNVRNWGINAGITVRF